MCQHSFLFLVQRRIGGVFLLLCLPLCRMYATSLFTPSFSAACDEAIAKARNTTFISIQHMFIPELIINESRDRNKYDDRRHHSKALFNSFLQSIFMQASPYCGTCITVKQLAGGKRRREKVVLGIAGEHNKKR